MEQCPLAIELAMVGAGLGITVMPDGYRAADVARLALEGFDYSRTLALVRRPREASNERARLLDVFEQVARSFRPLDDAERASIEELRLRVVVAGPGETFAALGRRTGNAWKPGETAIANGVGAGKRLSASSSRARIAHQAPAIWPSR